MNQNQEFAKQTKIKVAPNVWGLKGLSEDPVLHELDPDRYPIGFNAYPSTVNLGVVVPSSGTTINSTKTVKLLYDNIQYRKLLTEYGVPMPKYSPVSHFVADGEFSLDEFGRQFDLPISAKLIHVTQSTSSKVVQISNEEQLVKFLTTKLGTPSTSFFFEEKINIKKYYRLFGSNCLGSFQGYEVGGSMVMKNKSIFYGQSISEEGTTKRIKLSSFEEECGYATVALLAVDADLAWVDIVVTQENKMLITKVSCNGMEIQKDTHALYALTQVIPTLIKNKRYGY